MPMHNAQVAELFEKMAALLEIAGDNPFRIRAYRNAALTIRSLSVNLVDMIERNEDLTALPYIGKDLAEKIKNAVKKGSFPALEAMEKKLPPELDQLMRVAGLGGKKIKKLYDALKIKNLDDLKKAVEKGRVEKIEGFGKKSARQILASIADLKESSKRWLLMEAEKILEDLVNYLKKSKTVKTITVVGSNRRKKETVGDGDILVICKDGSGLMNRFVHYEDVDRVLAHGETKASVKLKSGFQVDLRALEEDSYGAALTYFTGSRAHTIALRKIAVKMGYKMNEYGLFKGKKKLAGRSEKEMYEKIGLRFIEPELREDQGEIEAAKKGKLPRLITLEDIKGDLHMHSTHTDGRNSIEEMVEAASKKGYEYVGITEHTQRSTIARGLKPKEVEKVIAEIDRLNKKFKNITILKSLEVDILEDGSLDMPEAILKKLDYTVCSIHSHFHLSKERQTMRIVKAMENDYFTIFGHPTGRLIGQRKPYELDMEKVMKAAQKRGCILELNAQPYRLDLNESYCKMAKEKGIKIAISTDAHSISNLDYMTYGIGQARRGWLEKSDVINTKPLKQLLEIFSQMRR